MPTFAVYERPEDDEGFTLVDTFPTNDAAQDFTSRRNIENREDGHGGRKLRVVPFEDGDEPPNAYIHKTPLNAAVRRNNHLFPSGW